MTPSLLADLAAAISAADSQPFTCERMTAQGGGCINRGFALAGTDGRRYFAKLNDADNLDMFAAEADGLRELEAAGAIRVPRPVACGGSGGEAFLILEWLNLGGQERPAELGRQLAQLHRHSQTAFGWWRDNAIGSTPQHNAPMPDWVEFFRAQRLRPQLERARGNGAPGALPRLGERLLERLEAFFPGYQPLPSLLHGDLWGGNHGYADGVPVLFDPAVYYGDREVDLAMSELFGGYPTAFGAAYREAWPLDAGYRVRRHLYNLYHVLNHFNLFGGGYAAQAEGMIGRLLAEAG
ncbi:MAG: fructosamine kinase family protein [Gallionellaceae bacterium]|nr:fructosamine kinase family protein [Gallionellaceae bacterium]